MNFLEDIKINPSWNGFINKEIREELNVIYESIKNKPFYPLKRNVLRFLELDLNKLKYIIIGMEPYPSSYNNNEEIIPEATGRSFEISSINNWQSKFKQSSLRNILKTIYYNEYNEILSMEEIRKKINENEFKIKQPKDWFNSLEKQGVLFLNATLTVEAGIVDSHTKLWENFMNQLIIYIQKNNPNIKYLLWGSKAKERLTKIINKNNFNNVNYIYSCHPRLPQFVKENCFEKIKDINWLG